MSDEKIVIAGIEFPSADYYDASDDPERLTHESPEEAVEMALDDDAALGESVADTIRRVYSDRDMTVTAYRPAVVTETWWRDAADDLAQRFREGFEESYCYASDDTDCLAKEAFAALVAALVPVLKASGAQVYDCAQVGSVMLTAEQIEAVMRECFPCEFEDDRKDGTDED